MAETMFKQFDIASDYSDHYFNEDGYSFTKGGRTYKNIMSEWRILKKNLPDGIYVRVYETRIDLMRAAIIGAAGTPYQDGLFFFDIIFPPDYPDNPPDVYYRSHGLSVNPILKDSGHICLSLLNTWSGRMSERWDSSRSSVLQVLVSIQALVLDERPYYNDHEIVGLGFLERICNQKVTAIYKTYNARVVALTCKSMLHLLKTPPKNFESFITQHFRQRASGILRSIADIDGSFQCTSMKLLYPELVHSFKENGWVVEEELLELEDQEKRPFPWLSRLIAISCALKMSMFVVPVYGIFIYFVMHNSAFFSGDLVLRWKEWQSLNTSQLS